MKYIEGKDRRQSSLFPISLEDTIENENTVRAVDMFVNGLDMERLGFKVHFPENGRPAYNPAALLKLYIYGYMNRVRSSRGLEKECKRNIEVMWLLEALAPDHNTISNFRRDNPRAIKKVFRATVTIARNFGLIGGILIAGDSTKLRAQNSKKNNFNPKKIDRHITYINHKIEEYSKALATADNDAKDQINQEIEKHKLRKENYKRIEKQLKETGETQVSTSDPQSRQMITRNNITEVAYNVQTTVDAKHCLPMDYKVTNTNDSKAMGNMLQRSKTILRSTGFTALYDKGYHTGSEFKAASDLAIDVMVAIPTVAAQAPNPAYNVEKFTYLEKEDCYVCPQGNKLTSPGTWHKAKTYLFKRYTTKACMQCPVKEQCSKAKYGKGVQRSEYQDYIDQNKDRIEKNKDYYRQRQAIVEHPYGTIKRQWGFDYIITKKGIDRASADVGLMFTAYNFRRLINIIDLQTLTKYLRMPVFGFLTIKDLIGTQISCFKGSSFYYKFNMLINQNSLNGLKFTHNLKLNGGF